MAKKSEMETDRRENVWKLRRTRNRDGEQTETVRVRDEDNSRQISIVVASAVCGMQYVFDGSQQTPRAAAERANAVPKEVGTQPTTHPLALTNSRLSTLVRAPVDCELRMR